ncbi:hypothetical protein CIB48_g5774 [Xylaria polymorpha]|nr:hypothetical protein CIB48_g5774 [Xylaria polymorpha]
MHLSPTARLSAAQSATVDTALATSTLALWVDDHLALQPTPEKPTDTPSPVLVYSDSTATGTIAIQLLKASGLNHVATCPATQPRSLRADLRRSWTA